ncbi:MAG TPA: GFA family protein [Myxococcota bacterium]|nr:GFA family protein [Myxococcota bacterium]
MALTGRCYCGQLRYEAGGTPLMKLICHCRECQYFTGGNSLPLIVTPEAQFQYTSGEVKKFARSDLAAPVTREFCPSCGTHVVSRSPGLPGAVIVKVGSLDDPSAFDKPGASIYTIDKQSFHHVYEGAPAFERTPR